jgi:hypothetical protein
MSQCAAATTGWLLTDANEAVVPGDGSHTSKERLRFDPRLVSMLPTPGYGASCRLIGWCTEPNGRTT